LIHGFLIIFIRHFIERFKRPVNIHAIDIDGEHRMDFARILDIV